MLINVIGAGVCGLSSAICLANQYPKSDITITSLEWHPNTTSNHGFGIVACRGCSFTDDATSVEEDVLQTKNFCSGLETKDSENMGIRLMKAILLMDEKSEIDKINASSAIKCGVGVRRATPNEIKDMGFKWSNIHRLFDGESDLSINVGHYYVIDTGKYLPWLMKELSRLKHTDGRKRVRFLTKKVSSFSDVGSCDLIVNCSGLGAKELASDAYVLPVRGQYLSVDMPDLDRLLMMNHTVVVPRFNDVAVGGVYQMGQYHSRISDEDTEDILSRAEIVLPAIRRAKVRKMDVGLRPARISGARVELEMTTVGNKTIPVIHNYGHGARGIAQHYGCSLRVCKLATSVFNSMSKL